MLEWGLWWQGEYCLRGSNLSAGVGALVAGGVLFKREQSQCWSGALVAGGVLFKREQSQC